jgi:hypothetical protein
MQMRRIIGERRRTTRGKSHSHSAIERIARIRDRATPIAPIENKIPASRYGNTPRVH